MQQVITRTNVDQDIWCHIASLGHNVLSWLSWIWVLASSSPGQHQAITWPHFYQTRSAWSMDQGSTKKRSAVHNFVPTVTKVWVMWKGLSLPHDTKFGNCSGEIVQRRVIFIWSLIHGSSWSGLIKVGPVMLIYCQWDHQEQISVKSLNSKYKIFASIECVVC